MEFCLQVSLSWSDINRSCKLSVNCRPFSFCVSVLRDAFFLIIIHAECRSFILVMVWQSLRIGMRALSQNWVTSFIVALALSEIVYDSTLWRWKKCCNTCWFEGSLLPVIVARVHPTSHMPRSFLGTSQLPLAISSVMIPIPNYISNSEQD